MKVLLLRHLFYAVLETRVKVSTAAVQPVVHGHPVKPTKTTMMLSLEKKTKKMIKLKPSPPSINQALAEEESARLAVLAWDSLESNTQKIMLNHDPGMLQYIQHCQSVVKIIDEWKSAVHEE